MKAQFLQEWIPSQHKHVEKAVRRFILSRYWETHHSPEADTFIVAGASSFAAIASVLGLAYTSSSDYAGLWACNTELYLDVAHKFKLVGFAHDANGFTYSIWWDSEENEIIFPI